MNNIRKHPIYKCYDSIKQRCLNPKHKSYPYYGGRGISCTYWKNARHFISWVEKNIGQRPSMNHSIDRIDNNRDYAPGNIRWATAIEQSSNKRVTIRLTFYGVSKTLKEWCSIAGVEYHTAWKRLKIRNWPPKYAVFAPKWFRYQS